MQTRYNDGNTVAPATPASYTGRFLENGGSNVKADCKRKGGRFSAQGKLSIEITHSTMAACEAGSLEERFVRDLTGAKMFFFTDGDLYVDIIYDIGTMKFSEHSVNKMGCKHGSEPASGRRSR